VALWHVAFNMMVSAGGSAGLPAAIVSAAVMVWGVIVAVVWWRTPRLLIGPELLHHPTMPREVVAHRGP
jgi:hypothetical protein